MMLDSAADNPVLDNDDGFSGSNLVPDNDAGFEPTCQWFTEKNKKKCFLNSFYGTIQLFRNFRKLAKYC